MITHRIFFKLGIFFFLIIAQSSSASTISITQLKNLVNQKQYAKIKKYKDEIDSEVLKRWLSYEILLHNIRDRPTSVSVREELAVFLKKYQGHQFAGILVETYVTELDKVIQNSMILKKFENPLILYVYYY